MNFKFPALRAVLFKLLGTFAALQKGNCELPHFCPYDRMEQLSSLWMDFYEISRLNIFRNSVDKFHVSLNSDKNSVYCT